MSRALKQISLAGIVVAFVFASFAVGQGPTMREDVRKDLDTASQPAPCCVTHS